MPLTRFLAAALATLAGVLGLAAAPALAHAASPTRTVTYRGVRLRVPAGWPVIDLAHHPTACVRFDRHALYLGTPGRTQRCPATAVGHTEAILATPGRSQTTDALLAPARGGSVRTTDAGRLVEPGGRVTVTATWRRAPALIVRALGIRSLASLSRRAPRPSAAVLERADAVSRAARATTADAPAVPGGVYTGLGFDACHTPSSSQMSSWSSSSYRAIGIYIGGENRACSQPNLTASWVSMESSAGWHLIPIYVGLQAPSNSCGCQAISTTSTSSPASEGTSDAQTAVADAQAVGIGTGNPLYLDMEYYSRTSTNSSAVLAYVGAWTSALHAAGYASGVYGNDSALMADLVSQAGTTYPEPDDVWAANWNGSQSTSDSTIPPGEWANHQRLHQYNGAHNETYGGATINIDSDYLDSATAAAGSSSGFTPYVAAAPSARVGASPTGALNVTPSWSGEAGITGWQIIGGESQTQSNWVSAPYAAGRVPLVTPNAYPYMSVRALGSGGQILGTSPVVASPNHIALYGKSVFVPPHGPAGIPVGCFDAAGCWLTTTITLGRQTLATTRPERMGNGGGLVFAGLTAAAQKLLTSARGHRFPVTVKVRDASGMSVTGRVTLTRFSTVGRGPKRTYAPSSAMNLIGGADFVSNGWVGGLLVRCSGTVQCAATTTITVGRQTIARGRSQLLGVGQIGYSMFTLTPAGHRLLASAPGNQLPVNVAVTTAGVAARGHIVLIGY